MKDTQKIAIIRDFLKYCYHELQIKEAPKIRLHHDNKAVKDQASFGGYYPDGKSIQVYMKNRNLADVLRTLGHELVHHSQHEIAGIDVMDGATGSDYENEANSKAGVLLRNYGKMNPMIYESVVYMEMINEEDTKVYQIYCDMDGVLCDFDAQFEHYFGNSPSEYKKEKGIPSFKNAIDEAGKDFWANMPWTSAGKRLWEKIGEYGVIILTDPSNFTDSKKGKLEWINLHLSPMPKSVIFKSTGKKHEVLQGMNPNDVEKCVLIDDSKLNTQPWESAGGIAFEHSDNNPTHYQVDLLKLKDK